MHHPSFVVEAGKPRRKSSFQEVGLVDSADQPLHIAAPVGAYPRPLHRRHLSHISERESRPSTSHGNDNDSDWITDESADDADEKVTIRIQAPAVRSSSPLSYTRLSVLLLFMAIAIPFTQNGWISSGQTALPVAEGGPIREAEPTAAIARRADSPIDICKRWSGQSAVVNGTLYYYGGRVSTDQAQVNDTWTSDFVSLDLTRSWDIDSPSLKGMPQPSGPPAIANGYLWNSHRSLFLYGGEFSDSPVAAPVAFSLWEYEIAGSAWHEHGDPKSSAGTNSEDAGQAIQRVAEGAGANMPSLGRGWYFGGHEDYLTTEGWSYLVGREYLKSFVEFTFPGVENAAVEGLSGAAGNDGVWRNITDAGIQNTGGFTERADGVLVYVPGFGKEGVLIALAGGTNASFTQMNVIDVYDIEGSQWYKQATDGPVPSIRVNPCAVVAAAPDGSSYNIYMFAGQNLQPYQNQTQHQDMWILTVPSFTWINVDMKDQSVPYGRSGHTCNIWDGQMVVVGGYIGNDIPCESPGVYVFNCSSLKWSPRFTSLSAGGDNQFSQHEAQKGADPSKDGLEGSYGYTVPDAVVSVIGGNGLGGATITKPVQSATAGPLATGKPITYTVTGPNGEVATETGVAGSGNGGIGNSGSSTNVGAIVAGVIAGMLAVVAGYLGFCAWLYRKQLQLYKNHVAAAQRASTGSGRNEKTAFFTPPPGGSSSGSRRQSDSGRDSGSMSGPGAGLTVPIGAAGRTHHPLQQAETHSDRSDANSSTENLLAGLEPTFVGVLLNPKRSLRIVNRD